MVTEEQIESVAEILLEPKHEGQKRTHYRDLDRISKEEVASVAYRCILASRISRDRNNLREKSYIERVSTLRRHNNLLLASVITLTLAATIGWLR